MNRPIAEIIRMPLMTRTGLVSCRERLSLTKPPSYFWPLAPGYPQYQSTHEGHFLVRASDSLLNRHYSVHAEAHGEGVALVGKAAADRSMEPA
jgi:hypothetical protein